MQEVMTLEDKKNLQVNKKKESFLQSVASKEEQLILAETLERKKLIQAEGKKAATKITDLTKEMLDSPYVKFDDDTEITFAEAIVAKTLADVMAKPNKTAKELSDLQKVVNGDTFDNSIKIVFETNGQDLGD